MQKANKRLIFSIVALVVAIVMVTSTTYAWFTISTNPKVEQFELNIVAGSGIYVSVDKTNWATYISTNKLIEEFPVEDVVLIPSTPQGVASGEAGSEIFTNTSTALTLVDMYNTNVEPYVQATAKAQALNVDENGDDYSTGTKYPGVASTDKQFGYYAFTLHFRSKSAYEVYLDTRVGSSGISSNMQSGTYTSTQMTTLGMEGELDIFAANAARIGITNNGASDKSLKAIYNLNAGKGADDATFMALPLNVDKNFAHVVWASDLTNMPLTAAQKILDANVNYNIPSRPATDSPSALYNPSHIVADLKGSNVEELDSANWYYQSVVVYVWLDGKDADCVADVTSELLKIDLLFHGRLIDATEVVTP